MLTIHGKSISGMVTIGPLRIFRHQPMDFALTEIEKPETEVARFDSARNAAAVKMKEFYQEAISHYVLVQIVAIISYHGTTDDDA